MYRGVLLLVAWVGRRRRSAVVLCVCVCVCGRDGSILVLVGRIEVFLGSMMDGDGLEVIHVCVCALVRVKMSKKD